MLTNHFGCLQVWVKRLRGKIIRSEEQFSSTWIFCCELPAKRDRSSTWGNENRSPPPQVLFGTSTGNIIFGSMDQSDLRKHLQKSPEETFKSLRKELGKAMTAQEMSCRNLSSVARNYQISIPFRIGNST